LSAFDVILSEAKDLLFDVAVLSAFDVILSEAKDLLFDVAVFFQAFASCSDSRGGLS
jgi:hypothetical protein